MLSAKSVERRNKSLSTILLDSHLNAVIFFTLALPKLEIKKEISFDKETSFLFHNFFSKHTKSTLGMPLNTHLTMPGSR